jgi:DNA polymerase-3 subunit gamma/tau
MSYKVLARKWRPATFDQVVGQPHILQSLSHALDTDRLHHAMLFTGTRGVGKTTIARILAKALNCEQGISSTPCGKCSNCIAVDEGRFIDLIEIDAASKTGVDDMRELLDNVQYLPGVGRFKVYLIDEVHMLSRNSFNALLKTLEEPPDHVKFLLATTDPQKLPVTVLSRCLQFNLKRLDAAQIRTQLADIVETEQVESDDEALNLLAISADGSMRDALSLLDQAIAFGSGKVTGEDVRSMLGSIEQRYIHAIIESVANEDTASLFDAIQDAADRSPDFLMVLNELLATLYHLSLVKLAPDIVEQRGLDGDWLKQASEKFSGEQLQLYYQICLTGKKDLPLAPDSRTGFEMLMLRMLAFNPGNAGPMDNTSSPSSKDKAVAPDQTPAQAGREYYQAPPAQKRKEPAADRASKTDKVREPLIPVEKHGTEQVIRTPADRDWSELVSTLDITGLTKQLALHMAPDAWDDDQLVLLIGLEHESIHSTDREKELIAALHRVLGDSVNISIRVEQPVAETPAQKKQRLLAENQQAAEQSINTDPEVAKLVDSFGASVSPGSIRPVN